MELFLATFLVIALAALGMAVGVIAGRRPIRAGCGRLDGAGDVTADCPVCGGSCDADKGSDRSARTPEPS